MRRPTDRDPFPIPWWVYCVAASLWFVAWLGLAAALWAVAVGVRYLSELR